MNINNTKRNKEKGFTLVETLVAITILMIAIAGPLVVASKSLKAAQYAKNQTIATFLAQETLEYIKNLKNNHVVKGESTTWLTTRAVNQFSSLLDLTTCINHNDGSSCDVDPREGTRSVFNNCGSAGCVLYKNSFGNYTNDVEDGVNTPFSRYIVVNSPGSDEANVAVTVNWYDGTNSATLNSVTLSSVLMKKNR